jgi:WD40 repeat protein
VRSTIEEGGYDLQGALLLERRWSMEANYLVSWASMVTLQPRERHPQYTRPCSISSTSRTMSQLTPSTTPIRTFEDHEGTVNATAVFPNKRRMVTGSSDCTLRLWDLETGVMLKKIEGHSASVRALAVSRDGQIIASGDGNGELIAWHGETGESLTKPINAHTSYKMLTFICDTVHQHSALIDRLHLQGYRPIRKRPHPGGKGSIRCRIHVHEPSFED